jgi:hypothetical protein
MMGSGVYSLLHDEQQRARATLMIGLHMLLPQPHPSMAEEESRVLIVYLCPESTREHPNAHETSSRSMFLLTHPNSHSQTPFSDSAVPVT